MVDVKNNFNLSFDLLKNNKYLFLPFFLSFVLFLISIFFFIFASGIHEPIKDYMELNKQYDEMVQKQLMQGDPSSMTFEQYMQGKLNFSDYSYLLSFETLLYFIISLLMWLLLSSYMINVGYYQNSQKLINPKKNISFSNSLVESISFYIKYLIIRVTIMIILYAPLILLLGLSIWMMVSDMIILGILLLLFGLLFSVFWMVYMGLKFFFAPAILYMEGGDVNSSLKNSKSLAYMKSSLELAKGRMKKILFVAFIVYGISLFMNYVSSQPLSSIITDILVTSNIITIFTLVILMIFFIILQAFLSCFLSIFVFHSYLDIKQNNGE